MKDIILITAYCPDSKKLNKLRKLVNQLQDFNEKYSIMIVSHSTIPSDIQEKVDLCLYDKKNELLTDWDLINQPFFGPNHGRFIQSGLLTGKNTHLAIWRMLILAFSVCKNNGYKKIHHIEYDCEILDDSEIESNSKLLNEYDFVYYVDKKENTRAILFGSFQSYKIDSIPEKLINLDEDWIKDLIRKSSSKSPEGMLKKILTEEGITFEKDRKVLELNGNNFATSEDDDGFNDWGVPYVDLMDNCVYFVVWNTRKTNGVRYTIIINDKDVFTTDLVPMGNWKIIKMGSIEDVKKILTIEDDKVRDKIEFNNLEDRELFKKISFRKK